jgi:hypothetical protein
MPFRQTAATTLFYRMFNIDLDYKLMILHFST